MPSRSTRTRAASKEETRAALMAAALEEFAEHGFDNPSLDAICARAGYTRGAFYVHFRDRAELMTAVVAHAMGGFLDAVIAQGDQAHDLEHTIERFAGSVMLSLTGGGDLGDPSPAVPIPPGVPFARVLDAVTRTPALRDAFRMLLEQAIARLRDVTAAGQEAGTVRADLDPNASATLLAVVAVGVLAVLDTGLPIDPVALRSTVLALLAAPRPH